MKLKHHEFLTMLRTVEVHSQERLTLKQADCLGELLEIATRYVKATAHRVENQEVADGQ